MDSQSKNIKGFATVTFMMPEHAVKAYSELDGRVLHGRMLHLLPGKDKETSKEDNLEGKLNVLLGEREAEEKVNFLVDPIKNY